MAPTDDRELKKGSADLLVLALLEREARHGYDLARLITERSGGVLQFHVASLYPLLYRLERKGWIEGRWVEKAGQRRRRYYKLTADGRRVLREQRRSWQAFVDAIHRIALVPQEGLTHGAVRFRRHVRAHLPPLDLDPPGSRRSSRNWPSRWSRPTRRRAPTAPMRPAAERAAHAVVRRLARVLARELVERRAIRRRNERPGGCRPTGADRPGRRGAVAAMVRREAWQDARYGLRWLARHRGFTAAALLTLSLTIGASSAIFSLVSAVLLAPLPFPDDERAGGRERGGARPLASRAMPFSPLDYHDYAGASAVVLRAGHLPQRQRGAGRRRRQRADRHRQGLAVDFRRAAACSRRSAGRFVPTTPGAGGDAAILSHALWTRRFDADRPWSAGRVLLDRQPFTWSA